MEQIEIPNLYIFLEPEQGVKALGLGTSWTLFDEDGDVIMGINADSFHPTQLRPQNFYFATLHLSHQENWPIDWLFIGMDFTYGNPPNTYLPHIISVTRWRILDYWVLGSDKYETVELIAPGGWTPGLLADMIPIFDEGYDYLYAVQVEWREGLSRGTRLFAFRVKSGTP